MDGQRTRNCWCLVALLVLHVTVVENGVISSGLPGIATRTVQGNKEKLERTSIRTRQFKADGGPFTSRQRNYDVAGSSRTEAASSPNVNIASGEVDRAHPFRLKRDQKKSNFDSFIPPEYILAVTVKPPNQWEDSSIHQLRMALSEVLHWPSVLIQVDKISLSRHMVGLYFMRNMSELIKEEGSILVPIVDLWRPNFLSTLQHQAPDLNIISIGAQSKGPVELDSKLLWQQPYVPYVVVSVVVVVVTAIGVTVYLCCCLKVSKESDEEEDIAAIQQVLYPSIKPETKDPLAIQPPNTAPPFLPKGGATPVPAQPARIRAKGLLERRGSNASLTLELSPSPELKRWKGTPPKESSALEFLLSAGHRLSRRDLRNVVKNPRSIHEEFWEIPMNHPEKVSVAGSGMKNRYKTIIPNEHSRVILPDDEIDPLSSYVNANYIRGYECEPKAYIATQGPMSHTIVDFWRLVWHEKPPIIVMITKLTEKDKPKCENYLPESRGLYGDIEVVVENITEKEGYTVRYLTLRCLGEVHEVMHYWYTAWPDHKPPSSPRMLLNLVKEVERNRYGSDHVTPRGPVFVHCSAGIGRTGCFVAISIGMRQLAEEHSVDILGIVCGMRLDRGGMIQTHEQYEFIHHALCEYERELEDSNLGEE